MKTSAIFPRCRGQLAEFRASHEKLIFIAYVASSYSWPAPTKLARLHKFPPIFRMKLRELSAPSASEASCLLFSSHLAGSGRSVNISVEDRERSFGRR